MAKTNDLSIDRPPRSGPATRGWKIQRTLNETRIVVPGADRGLLINKSLTDEQLDLLRLAHLQGREVTPETVVGLLDDVDLNAALVDHYREHAYAAWRKAVGLT